MCQRPTISKCVENWEKLNHLGSYEQELKVLNRVDLVLGYSWNLNNSPQRMDYQRSDRRGRRKGWKRGGGWGNEGSKRCMNALFVCFFFFLAGWFFLCTPGLKSFLLLFFLNPYFDLFYSVIRLNFPHPLPQSSIPVGGHTFTKTVSSPLFTATAVPPVLLSKITICSAVWPTNSRILCNLNLAVKNNAT